MAAISFKYSLFLNNFFKSYLYFQGYLFTKADAVLLGGCQGFYLKNITKKIQGIVTIMAQQNKRSLTYSTVPVWSSIRNPGTEAPRVIDNKLNNTPVKPTRFTFSDLNQLMAILLGVLRIKIFPTAARVEPARQNIEFPLSNSNLSQTPPTKKMPPTIKLIRMPWRLMSQLQGKAKRG